MTTLTIEQGNNTEIVSNAVIQKLYNIASNSTNVTLAGNLQCERCYQDVYDYFTGYVTEGVKRFPNLSLTVTGGRYATFSDPVILDYFAKSEYGDGVGAPANSIFSISTFPKRETIPNTAFKYIYSSIIPTGHNTSYLNYGCYAFYKDKDVISFNELGLFSNIISIRTSMFRGSTLKYIDLSNITNIEAAAFAGADLTGIINIPKFKLWGNRTVSTSVDVDYLYFANNAHMTEIHIGADVSDKDKITSVPILTFLNCSSLSEITGLNMVTNIGESAFFGCSSLKNLQDLNNTTTINIGDKSFLNCTSLKCIDLTNINGLREYVFDGCSNLTALDTNDLDHINDNTEYTFSTDILGRYAFRNTGLNGKTLKFTNIDTILGNTFEGSGLNKFIGTNVTTLGSSAFKNCAQLLEVQLGNVTTIDVSVFNNCSNLTTIKFGNLTNDFSNITSIGNYAFDGCSSLSSISNLTNVLNIGNYSFRNCGTLVSLLSLPNLTSIGTGAFNGCTGIQSVTDLGQITELTSGCFRDCINLTSIIIPGTVTYASFTAMHGSGLLRIIVKEGCDRAYFLNFDSYNGSIRYIEFPSTLTSFYGGSLYKGAFSSNPNNSVIFVIKAVTPPGAMSPNGGITETCYEKISKIYVPDDSVSTYKTSASGVWRHAYFRLRIAPISQLETDNPTYWAVYQSGLSNS